eukprot:TRINITY_DN13215_c0_g1_i1.p1 TRINITY_DN13215_c0_g1~~TRINITY_DN13215_c0_g1_i1.p1  ORF type:complete len:193 (-),score=18.91 TRINITY_DN13215_c0_g1_i1:127-705(-)
MCIRDSSNSDIYSDMDESKLPSELEFSAKKEEVKHKSILKKESSSVTRRISFGTVEPTVENSNDFSIQILKEVNSDLTSLFTRIEQNLSSMHKHSYYDSASYAEPTFRPYSMLANSTIPEKTYTEIGMQAHDSICVEEQSKAKSEKRGIYSMTKVYRPLSGHYARRKEFKSVKDFYKRSLGKSHLKCKILND